MLIQPYERILLAYVTACVLSVICFDQGKVLAAGDECQDVLTQVTLEVSPLMLAQICKDNSPSTVVVSSGNAEWEDNIYGFCTSFDLNIGSVKMNHTLPDRALSVQLVKNQVTLDAALVGGGGASYHGPHLISVWGHKNTRFVLRIVPVCPTRKMDAVKVNSTNYMVTDLIKASNSKNNKNLSKPVSLGSPFRPPGSTKRLSVKDIDNWKKQYRDTYNHETGFLPYKSDFPPRKHQHRKRGKLVVGGKSNMVETTSEGSVGVAKLNWMEQKRLLFEKKMKMLRNYIPEEDYYERISVPDTGSTFSLETVSTTTKDIEETTEESVRTLNDLSRARSTKEKGLKLRNPSIYKSYVDKQRSKQKLTTRKHFKSVSINVPPTYVPIEQRSTRVPDNVLPSVMPSSNQRIDSKMRDVSANRKSDTLLGYSNDAPVDDSRIVELVTQSTSQTVSSVSSADAISSTRGTLSDMDNFKMEEDRHDSIAREPVQSLIRFSKTNSDDTKFRDAEDIIRVEPVTTRSYVSNSNSDQHFNTKTFSSISDSSRLDEMFSLTEIQTTESSISDRTVTPDITSVSSSIPEVVPTVTKQSSDITQSHDTRSVSGTTSQPTPSAPVMSASSISSISNIGATFSSRKTPPINVGSTMASLETQSSLIPSMETNAVTTDETSSPRESSTRIVHAKTTISSSVRIAAPPSTSGPKSVAVGHQNKSHLEEIILGKPAAVDRVPEIAATKASTSTAFATKSVNITPPSTAPNNNVDGPTNTSTQSPSQLYLTTSNTVRLVNANLETSSLTATNFDNDGDLENSSSESPSPSTASSFSSAPIERSTVPTVTGATTLRVDHSTSQPRENVSKEGDDDSGSDALWPVVAALVVGIPAVIVFGIAITVIHRRRLAQPVHTSITTSTLYPSL